MWLWGFNKEIYRNPFQAAKQIQGCQVKIRKETNFHIRTVSKTLNSIKWKITEINFILQILIIFANIRKKVKNCFFLRHEKIVPTGNIPIKKQRTFFCICVFVLKCLQLIGWVIYLTEERLKNNPLEFPASTIRPSVWESFH